jgi:hypothetical protein
LSIETSTYKLWAGNILAESVSDESSIETSTYTLWGG